MNGIDILNRFFANRTLKLDASLQPREAVQAWWDSQDDGSTTGPSATVQVVGDGRTEWVRYRSGNAPEPSEGWGRTEVLFGAPAWAHWGAYVTLGEIAIHAFPTRLNAAEDGYTPLPPIAVVIDRAPTNDDEPHDLWDEVMRAAGRRDRRASVPGIGWTVAPLAYDGASEVYSDPDGVARIVRPSDAGPGRSRLCDGGRVVAVINLADHPLTTR